MGFQIKRIAVGKQLRQSLHDLETIFLVDTEISGHAISLFGLNKKMIAE
jgi:hypothetical protein